MMADKNNRIKVSISQRLISWFAVIAFAVIIINANFFFSIRNNTSKLIEGLRIYSPAVDYLNEVKFFLLNSKILVDNINRTSSGSDKNKLESLMTTEFPKITASLSPLINKWEKKEKDEYNSIKQYLDSLFKSQKDLMNKWNANTTPNAVVDTGVTDMMSLIDSENVSSEMPVEQLFELNDRINEKIQELITKINEKSKDAENSLIESIALFGEAVIWRVVILLMAIVVIAFFVRNSLVKPIKLIRNTLYSLSQGHLPNNRLPSRTDEIGEMSEALGQLINNLKNTSEFAKEIGSGDFNANFKPLSDQDVLGNSLITMRENLLGASKEQERRKKEDEQRNWATQGIAKFSEILRKNTDNLEELAYNVISELVKYLDANQGGIFIVSDTKSKDAHLELKACYAYNRRKYMERSVEFGVGLLGQCAIEKETIYLTEIPNNYIRITSGLGDENPCALLLVPLRLNEEIFGVLEIASFQKFERYQIEFVEKIGESIASTISTVKINENTARLLRESQEISEQMTQQEEEMRQNIEEMSAAQEEMQKRIEMEKKQQEKYLSEYKDQIKALQQKNLVLQDQMSDFKNKFQNLTGLLENSAGTYTLRDGMITDANKKFLKMLDLNMEELSTIKQIDMFSPDYSVTETFKLFMAKLNSGKLVVNENKYKIKDKEYWFLETFTPSSQKGANSFQVVSIDISKEKRKENELRKKIDELTVKVPKKEVELGESDFEIDAE